MKLDARIDRYLYEKPYMRELVFRSPKGGRSFMVLIAGAYDAGIIGPEHNGIVVLDNDTRQVVLDQHCKISSGYFGPDEAQKAEFERICAMEWSEFSAFCRQNPRYRKGVKDLDKATEVPTEVSEIDQAIAKGRSSRRSGPDIRTAEMKAISANPEVKIDFPHKTREAIIAFLANHEGHAEHMNYGFLVSWNVKMNGGAARFDESGRGGDEKVDPAFDRKWAEFVEKNDDPSVFFEACESGLRQFTEGEYTTYPGDDQGKFKFGQIGRTGGHLYLSSWDGPQPSSGHTPMRFEDRGAYVDWLKDLSDADLVRFYKLVRSVDIDTAPEVRAKEISHQINFIRASMEEVWKAEMMLTP